MQKKRVQGLLDGKLYRRLDYFCSKNRYSQSKVISLALDKYLNEESSWEILWKRLNRNQNAYQKLETRVLVLTAAFELFMRYFFALTPELSDEEKEQAYSKTEYLFEKYMEKLKENVQSGGVLNEKLNGVFEG